jgi:hypothetical protein
MRPLPSPRPSMSTVRTVMRLRMLLGSLFSKEGNGNPFSATHRPAAAGRLLVGGGVTVGCVGIIAQLMRKWGLRAPVPPSNSPGELRGRAVSLMSLTSFGKVCKPVLPWSGLPSVDALASTAGHGTKAVPPASTPAHLALLHVCTMRPMTLTRGPFAATTGRERGALVSPKVLLVRGLPLRTELTRPALAAQLATCTIQAMPRLNL